MKAAETQSTVSRDIIAALRATIGSRRVALHEPTFRGNEWVYVKECLDTTFVSSVGKFVDRFEADLATFTGARHAVAVVNGTSALHVALKLAGVIQHDEVLVPALSFIATANSVVYCGAVPHFVDSDSGTLGLDAGKLREHLSATTEIRGGVCVNRSTGRAIRVVVPMHTFGHPVDLEGLQSVCCDFGLCMVEDAAESLGSYYDGIHTGTFGRLGVLSFNGNKTITTGGGGAIVTNDPDLARRAKHITTTAKLPHAWEYRHDETGFNYRMPNLNAALGCAQIEQLPSFLESKRRLYGAYKKAFTGVRNVSLFAEPPRSRSNYWLQALVLDEGTEGLLEGILKATNAEGFMTRPIWTLMHHLPPYRECPRMDLSQAESLARRVINIPSSPGLIPDVI